MSKALENILSQYKPISIEEMDSVKLMNRVDTKYFFHTSLIAEILQRSSSEFFILEINKKRHFAYSTTYFDTCDFLLYNHHLNGILNRYKIRQRRYDATGAEFFEIKFKSNKGYTIKNRMENNESLLLNKATAKFLKNNSPYEINQLQLVLKNNFTRITMVDFSFSSRITVDFGISFNVDDKHISFPNLGIAEVKQSHCSCILPFLSIMRQMGRRPNGISKYCLGAASLYQNLKINSIKAKLIQINKFHNNVINLDRQY